MKNPIAKTVENARVNLRNQTPSSLKPQFKPVRKQIVWVITKKFENIKYFVSSNGKAVKLVTILEDGIAQSYQTRIFWTKHTYKALRYHSYDGAIKMLENFRLTNHDVVTEEINDELGD